MILLKMIPGRMAGIGFDPVQVPRFANVEAPTLLRFVNDCCARRKNSSTKNVRSWRRTMCALWKLIGFAARRQDVQSRRTSSRPSTLPSKRLCYLKSKRRERRLRPHSKHQWGLPRTPTLRANSRPPTLGQIAKNKNLPTRNSRRRFFKDPPISYIQCAIPSVSGRRVSRASLLNSRLVKRRNRRLLHAVCVDNWMWQGLLPLFPGVRAVPMDLPSHGGSKDVSWILLEDTRNKLHMSLIVLCQSTPI